MKLKNTFSKIEKAGGRIQKEGPFYIARFAGFPYLIQMTANGGDLDTYISTLKVRRIDDLDEPVSDYSAGSFFDSVNKAIEWVKH